MKEQVELSGTVRVVYVRTKDQHADSWTKFLKGGPEQKRALEHLAVAEVEPEAEPEVKPRQPVETIRTRSNGDSYVRAGERVTFVGRVIVPESRDCADCGLVHGVRRKKCNHVSVAIGAQPCLCLSCIETFLATMVKFFRDSSQDVMQLSTSDWRLPSYEQSIEQYPPTKSIEELDDESMDPIEI